MARPSLYKPEYAQKAAEYASKGLTDKQIAKNLGVHSDTFIQWKKKYPELVDALNEAKEIVDQQVENALFKRACGFVEEDKVFPPDVTACIFWLKNRQINKWRDVKERINHNTIEESETGQLELARRVAHLLTQTDERTLN